MARCYIPFNSCGKILAEKGPAGCMMKKKKKKNFRGDKVSENGCAEYRDYAEQQSAYGDFCSSECLVTETRLLVHDLVTAFE